MSNQPRRRRVGAYPKAEEMTPAAFLLPEEPAPQQGPAAPETDAQSGPDEPYVPADTMPPWRSVLATNTGVRLACTMSAMMGFFAIFLCWAEQESRVIRRFSVQSACLTALHAAVGLGALLIGGVLGGIPYMGLMVKLMCLLGYIAALILLVVTRIRLMRSAWQGMRFSLPAPLEKLIHRYY